MVHGNGIKQESVNPFSNLLSHYLNLYLNRLSAINSFLQGNINA